MKKQYKYRIKRRNSWLKFLPKNPKCEICNKKLKYFSGIPSLSVNFDHKNTISPIKYFPSDWLRTKLANKENLNIWKKANFGILCNKCNRFLITKKRKQWILNVVQYIFKH